MNRSLRACGYTAGLWILAWGALSETGWARDNKTLHLEHGQELFEHVWQPGHDDEAGGDGLGPLFNERSCIACHMQGGIGGAGPNKNNVLVLSAVADGVPEDSAFRARLAALHPGFADGTTIVLHQFSTNQSAYSAFREHLLGFDPHAGADPVRQGDPARPMIRNINGSPVKSIELDGGITLVLAQRNTTPLFGLGLIDSISKEQIEKVVAIETEENPKVHGRFIGRFGWRGQMLELSDFVRGACATELGLQVSSEAQAVDPSATTQGQSSGGTNDLTDRQCDEMTTFVAKLPAPRRLQRTNHQEVAAVRSGEHLFKFVGCAVCHRPTLGEVNGIYSDLLVHDMGAKLADPTPAPSAPAVLVATVTVRPGSYYRPPGVDVTLALQPGPVLDTLARLREWKTPPLWGLRDSGPYLHDGRAETVEDAIGDHGGEAADSVDRYRALPNDARTRLLAFLATLAAPDPSTLPKLKATKDHPPAERRPPRLTLGFAATVR